MQKNILYLHKFINARTFTIVSALLILALYFVSYYAKTNNVEMGVDVFSYGTLSLFSIIALLYGDDGYPFVPIIIYALLTPIISDMSFSTVPMSLIIFAFIFLTCIIIFLIKHKVNIFIGKMKWSYLTVCLAFLLVSLHLGDGVPEMMYFFLLILPAYFFLYLFFSSTIKGDKRELLAQAFMWAGLIIYAQSMNYIINTPFDILQKQFLTGNSHSIPWANTNIGAIVLNMTIGMTLALVMMKPKNYFYQLSALLQIIALIVTVSRAGIMIFAFMFLIYIVLFYKYRPSNKHFFIRLSLLLMISLLIYLVNQNLITPIISHFIKSFQGSDVTSGRTKLLEEAIEYFKANPLFGIGVFGVMDRFIIEENGVTIVNYAFRSFHSMPLQVLACGGIVGALAVIYNYIDLAKLLFHKVDAYRWFVIVVFLGASIHALGDNVYMMIHYTILSFTIFGVLEGYDREKVLKNHN